MIRYHADWVLPIAGPAIHRGAVGVSNGRIVYVGPQAAGPEGAELDLEGCVLMPGMVNVHTRLELTAMRGFLEDLEFPAWIRWLVMARREVLSRDMLLDATHLGIAEGVAAGVTTFADIGESGLVFQAMVDAGVRGVAYQEVSGPAPALCDDAIAELRQRVDLLHQRETRLVRVGVAPHAAYTVSDRLFAATTRYAVQSGLRMAVPVAESDAEVRLVAEGRGPFADDLVKRGVRVERRAASPVQLLRGLRVLDAQPLLVHCVHATPADIHAIAASGCAVAHCPASNAKLGHGVAPLTELLDAGIVVGLGSDCMAGNNRMNLLGEAMTAALQQRARAGRTTALTAERALRLATIGGARALGLQDEVGTLEVGKSADLAAFRLDPALGPVYEPESALLFALHDRRAHMVTVAGKVLVRDGVLLQRDSALAARVQGTADALRAWRAGRT